MTKFFEMGKFDGQRGEYNPPEGLNEADKRAYDNGYEIGVVYPYR